MSCFIENSDSIPWMEWSEAAVSEVLPRTWVNVRFANEEREYDDCPLLAWKLDLHKDQNRLPPHARISHFRVIPLEFLGEDELETVHDWEQDAGVPHAYREGLHQTGSDASNKQEDDMVGVSVGKCVLTDSQGIVYEGMVTSVEGVTYGAGWRSEASVTVFHERSKPEPKPDGRPMTRNDNGTVTFEGISGSWKLLEGRRPILLSNAWYQAVYEHELADGSVWSSGLVHGRGQTSGMVAFRRMERCGECGCLSSALDKACLHCGCVTAASDLTPKPSPRKPALTPHGRQCAAREALVAARAAESDAVRDAMIDLALRLLGGADEQP